MPSLRTRSHRASRPVGLALVAFLVVVQPLPSAGAGSPTWSKPVPGAVVATFLEPPTRFAAGHRGVDFAAPAGAPVRAANDGTVTFAGSVAGTLHVVVAHPGGIRTSYSFLSRVDVRVGATVSRGDVLGAAGGSGSGHRAGVLHFGARSGTRYFDPMLLFGPTDLTQLVHLVPADRPGISDPAWGTAQGPRYTDRSTRAPARDLSRSQQHPGRLRLRAGAQASGRTT